MPPAGERPVEADEIGTSYAGGQMQRVGEVASPRNRFKRSRQQQWILHMDVACAGETAQRFHDHRRRQAVGLAQHPFCFEHHRCGDEDLVSVEQRLHARELVDIVRRQKSDDDVSIDRAHGAPELRPRSPDPSLQPSWAAHCRDV